MSPLEAFLGKGSLSGPARFVGTDLSDPSGRVSEEEQQWDIRLSELAAECMRERGFEYVPLSSSHYEETRRRYAELDKAAALDVEEYVQRYGYGAVWTQVTLPLETSSSQDAEDPNEQYRESLSPDGQEAYGEESEECHAQATVNVEEELGPHPREQTGDVTEQFLQFGGINSDISALRDRINSDPRLEEAWRRWSDCMAGRGYPGFDNQSEVKQELSERLHNLHAEASAAPEGRASFEASDLYQDKLAEIRDFELGAAAADLACQQEGEYQELYREVAFELEEQFIEDHREKLERYRDWLAENKL